jgi:hypothetical protein
MMIIKDKKNIVRGSGRRSEKGVSLYMTIVMMAVLFTMVLGVTIIIIRGLDILKGASDSIKAFHAADTGVERALYNIRVNNDCSPICGTPCTIGGDSNWTYSLDYTGGCSASSISISAKGTYYGSQRKIEVSY